MHIGYEFGRIVYSELAVEIVLVSLDSALGNIEPGRDFLAQEALGRKPGNLNFPGRQFDCRHGRRGKLGQFLLELLLHILPGKH